MSWRGMPEEGRRRVGRGWTVQARTASQGDRAVGQRGVDDFLRRRVPQVGRWVEDESARAGHDGVALERLDVSVVGRVGEDAAISIGSPRVTSGSRTDGGAQAHSTNCSRSETPQW